MCCSCASPYSRNGAVGSAVSDQVAVAGVLLRLGCRGRAACAIADRMRRAVCRGGSASFTGSVEMELVKRWKCAVYHFVTSKQLEAGVFTHLAGIGELAT